MRLLSQDTNESDIETEQLQWFGHNEVPDYGAETFASF